VDEVQKNRAIARSTADAPEIDGVVYVNNVKNAKPGEFMKVEIIGSDAHDLRAKAVNP
jgi:ribosomal protein S12 methylthiotransferase